MNQPHCYYKIDDLERIASEATDALSRFSGRRVQLNQWPPVNDKRKLWELRDWEIDRFVRAYRKKLFCFRCRWGSADAEWRNGRPRVDIADGIMALGKKGESLGHEFLVVWPFVRLFSQEYLLQFSAAWEIVGIYEQPIQRLEAETDQYAIDLCIYDGPRPPYGTGKPVIGGEVKVREKKHNKLVSDVRRCRGLLLDKKHCGEDHRKCLWIQQNPTVKYLWVRSQDKSELFKVIRGASGSFDLSERLPDSQMESILSCQNWI